MSLYIIGQHALSVTILNGRSAMARHGPISNGMCEKFPQQKAWGLHISQFAALLRTLSKQHGRQIVIAVHKKPLFDYLALELSPSFLGDRLITSQLGRSSEGMTTLDWEVATFAEDNSIAV
jgi:hypothetical protein